MMMNDFSKSAVKIGHDSMLERRLKLYKYSVLVRLIAY